MFFHDAAFFLVVFRFCKNNIEIMFFCLFCFLKLREAWQEVEVERSRSQQLQAQVEELQEEVSLQESRSHLDASLLSELEAADWGVSKVQVQEFIFVNQPGSTVDRLAKASLLSDQSTC